MPANPFLPSGTRYRYQAGYPKLAAAWHAGWDSLETALDDALLRHLCETHPTEANAFRRGQRDHQTSRLTQPRAEVTDLYPQEPTP